MKLIHTSDWHIGRTLFDYSLLEDQAYFLNQLTDYALEIKADAILVAGDIYNRAVPSAQAVELLDGVLERLVLRHGIPVIMIAGNHDSPQRLSFGSRLLKGAGLTIAGSPAARLERAELPGGVDVYLLPYFIPAQVRLLLGDEGIATFNDAFAALMERNLPLLDRSRTNILMAHGFFSSLGREREDLVFSSSELSIGMADIMDITLAAGFDYAALGHLHAPQKAGEHARYSGSPLKYSLSESLQKKSITVLEIENGRIDVSTHAFEPLRDVRTIAGPFEELANPDNQAVSSREDYVYANILGDGAILFAMQKLRAVFPNILGLSFITPGQENGRPVHLGEDLSQRPVEELFGEFYRQITGEALSPGRAGLINRLLKESEVQP